MPPVSRPVPGLLVLGLLLAGGGLLVGREIGRQTGPAACGTGSAMRRVELVFGLSRKDKPDITQEAWQTFLEREVTPRFPDGLTVLVGNGQWRNGDGRTVREPARLLLVWAAPAADLSGRIEAVREAWKREHSQESVLRAEAASCVAF
jgi:hypothetical protein